MKHLNLPFLASSFDTPPALAFISVYFFKYLAKSTTTGAIVCVCACVCVRARKVLSSLLFLAVEPLALSSSSSPLVYCKSLEADLTKLAAVMLFSEQSLASLENCLAR